MNLSTHYLYPCLRGDHGRKIGGGGGGGGGGEWQMKGMRSSWSGYISNLKTFTSGKSFVTILQHTLNESH